MPRFHRIVALCSLLLVTSPSFPTRADASAQPLALAISAIAVNVADLDRSVLFYHDVLGFTVEDRTEMTGLELEQLEGVFGAHTRSVRLRLGEETVVLRQYLAPRGRPIPPDMRSNDAGFQHIAIVVSDMDRAYQHLREHRVRYLSTAPQVLPAWNRAAAGIKAFYFADPDDHPLEIIWFPPGKGDPRWQHAKVRGQPLRIFLGIDHTAILSTDTVTSVRFYRDTLGLRVTGTSENYGTEQEHLNNVFGAHLQITGLRAVSGPGIELLEYLAPRNSRVLIPDLRANDLLHWETVVRTSDVDKTVHAVSDAGATPVSPRITSLDDTVAGTHRSMLVRDPDGHALLLTE